MATIEDVAKEAGVSIATVSRFLHNNPKVLPETRERVREAIERLEYHPNQLARQFRTQKTGNVLILVPDLGNTFYYEIIAGAERVAEEHDYHVLIAEIHNKSQLEEYFFECLKQKQVDGIITFSAKLAPEYLESLSKRFPVVVACRYYETLQLPNVTIDNRKASRDMTTYLLNLGHRRVCCLAGDRSILLYQDRLNGYLDALRARDIEIRPELICESTPDLQGGRRAIERLFSTGEQFTAVVACGDTLAIGAVQAQDMHLDVPSDVAVTGFDDIELSSLCSPALTTVRQPKQQNRRAVHGKLLDLIDGRELPNQHDILNYELVIRESTGDSIEPA